jgi:AraC family transcriptional regulator, activator of mtrCDE
MAAIDELLASLDAEVRTFSVCKVENGWALSLDADDAPVIHYGLKGSGKACFDNGSMLVIEPHDFLLVPPRQPHRIETEGQDLKVVPAAENCVLLADALLEFRAGSEPDFVMICGKIEAKYAGTIGLFDRLDQPVAVRLKRTDPLRQAFEAMLAELACPTVGTRALADALLKQCLVLLVRRMAAGRGTPAWLLSIVDSRLAAVVTAIMENPGANHTLKSLAERAGMSRSDFALQFTLAFGISPMAFVKDVRLRYAAKLLCRTNLPVSVIASKIGYARRTHFSRTFRASYGLDPQSFRARDDILKSERKQERNP